MASVRFLSADAAVISYKLLTALDECAGERIFASWNQLDGCLRRLDALRAAASTEHKPMGTDSALPL